MKTKTTKTRIDVMRRRSDRLVGRRPLHYTSVRRVRTHSLNASDATRKVLAFTRRHVGATKRDVMRGTRLSEGKVRYALWRLRRRDRILSAAA